MAETLAAGTRSTPDGSTLRDAVFATDWDAMLWALDFPLPKRGT